MTSQIYTIDGIDITVYRTKKWWMRLTTGITAAGKIYHRSIKPLVSSVRHEYTHVLQEAEEGGMILFRIKYLYWCIRRGYLNNPFELEARLNQNTEGYLQTRKPYAWKQYK